MNKNLSNKEIEPTSGSSRKGAQGDAVDRPRPALGAGCLCQLCGQRYMVDLNLPDDLWEQIRGLSPAGANLMCGPCIGRRIERLGRFDAFFLTDIAVYFQSAVSGLWYTDPRSAGSISAVKCGMNGDHLPLSSAGEERGRR